MQSVMDLLFHHWCNAKNEISHEKISRIDNTLFSENPFLTLFFLYLFFSQESEKECQHINTCYVVRDGKLYHIYIYTHADMTLVRVVPFLPKHLLHFLTNPKSLVSLFLTYNSLQHVTSAVCYLYYLLLNMNLSVKKSIISSVKTV